MKHTGIWQEDDASRRDLSAAIGRIRSSLENASIYAILYLAGNVCVVL